jgi:hypothetical protein
MTVTRRALLRLAAGAVVLGACSGPARETTTRRYRIFVTTKDGVSVLDQDGRGVTPPTVIAASTPDYSQAVTATPAGAGTRIAAQDLATGRKHYEHTLDGRLEPRIVSADGALVASVTPGGAGIYGLHEPGGRQRTIVVVSGPTGERARLDLPGNLEPEAFSPDGGTLYVLDFTPAGKPVRYRVQAVDLTTRRMVPIGDVMRVHRIARVYDPRRAILFTVCSREEERVALVHCLHVGKRREHRITLPAPYGQGRPGVHGIALGAGRLSVVHSLSASVVDIDPDRLVITRVGSFTDDKQDGKPGVQITPSGGLAVSVDTKVIVTRPRREIATPGETRGLALGVDNDVWAGHPNGLVHHDLASGDELGRIRVRDLYVLKHVRAA